MATSVTRVEPRYLRALVDMGSNGIRFSISSLQPPTERIMPTLYQHRVGISLYDAQYSASGERIPIDNQTISNVVKSFRHFKQTCQDFGVPEEHITVLATEATRTAVNSEDFRKRIRESVGWDVRMLPKEEEGRIGAMGVASSLPELSGLVMDLGGGSTQLSWIVKDKGDATVRMPDSGAVSMPYGAAALSRRLAEAERMGTTDSLKDEIRATIKEAYAALKVPIELENAAMSSGGFSIYLSGGGFRGWGYVLMSQHHVAPYPIPVINGFKVNRKDFLGVEQVKAAAAASLEKSSEAVLFRVSERRAGQVPAVAILVNVLAESLPMIKDVRFCQGGVREGYLFSSLSSEIRTQLPLVVATRSFANSELSTLLIELMQSCFPTQIKSRSTDDYLNTFTAELFGSFANLIYFHSSCSKDLQASAALRSTTTGILANVHGVLHESRILIALLLCARWGGSIPPVDEPFKQSLERLVESPWTLWWINYLGAVASLIASVYPAGVVTRKPRLKLDSRWAEDDRQRAVLVLHATISEDVDQDDFSMGAQSLEKVGKKKRWIGGKDGIGYKVAVDVTVGNV